MSNVTEMKLNRKIGMTRKGMSIHQRRPDGYSVCGNGRYALHFQFVEESILEWGTHPRCKNCFPAYEYPSQEQVDAHMQNKQEELSVLMEGLYNA